MDKADFDDLLSRLKEIVELLEFPALSGHTDRAGRLALSIARSAPSPIPHLAMLVADAANNIRQDPRDSEARGRFTAAVGRLRAAVELIKSHAAA